MRLHRYLQLCFSEGLRGLAGNRRTVAPAIAIIAVSLVVLGSFLMVSENLAGLLARWRERGHVQLYVEGSATDEQIAAIDAMLAGTEAIEAHEFIDPDEAARRFRRDFAELGDMLAFLEENPLPASFTVDVLPAYRDEVSLQRLAAEWEAQPGVESAQYDLQIIRRLEFGVNGLRFGGVLLGGAVLLAAIITTANVIRVLVMERRREIVVLRLTGATEAVVRGRFLAEGAIQGLIGSLLAILFLFGAYRLGVAYIGNATGPLALLVSIEFLDPVLFVVLIGSGVTAGLVGAWLAFGAAGALR